MNTVNVKFQVSVADSRYSRYGTDGEAELDFDIPEDMLQADVDYADILKGLFTVALQRYKDKKLEDKEE